jgi:trk system potassium uptake protein TrkA
VKRFVVIGLGNFGASVGEALYRHGHDVVAIDHDPNVVERTAPKVTRAVVGDGRQRETLDRLGAADCDAGIISTGDDITASILAILALRDLEVKEIYVKVISHDHARIATRMGVTETVFPEREAAINLGTRLSASSVFSYVRLGTGVGIQEMIIPSEWEGKTLRELQLPTQYRLSVVAIHDVLRSTMLVPPDPDRVLVQSDTLLVVGTETNLERVASLM